MSQWFKAQATFCLTEGTPRNLREIRSSGNSLFLTLGTNFKSFKLYLVQNWTKDCWRAGFADGAELPVLSGVPACKKKQIAQPLIWLLVYKQHIRVLKSSRRLFLRFSSHPWHHFLWCHQWCKMSEGENWASNRTLQPGSEQGGRLAIPK